MRRATVILAVLVAAAVAGYVVWLLTDSTTASYIVGVVGTAVGIAALVVSPGGDRGSRLRARLRLDNVTESNVTGVDATSDADANATIRTKDVKGSSLTGVRSRPRK
jgi:hypothetical protein